jgi:hypothetical protein
MREACTERRKGNSQESTSEPRYFGPKLKKATNHVNSSRKFVRRPIFT